MAVEMSLEEQLIEFSILNFADQRVFLKAVLVQMLLTSNISIAIC